MLIISSFHLQATADQVLAWGSGLHNRLGTGAADNVLIPRPVDVIGSATIMTTNESRSLLVADITLATEVFERTGSALMSVSEEGDSAPDDTSSIPSSVFDSMDASKSGPLPTWLRGEMNCEYIAAGTLREAQETTQPVSGGMGNLSSGSSPTTAEAKIARFSLEGQVLHCHHHAARSRLPA